MFLKKVEVPSGALLRQNGSLYLIRTTDELYQVWNKGKKLGQTTNYEEALAVYGLECLLMS
jgi:hypothetical protein